MSKFSKKILLKSKGILNVLANEISTQQNLIKLVRVEDEPDVSAANALQRLGKQFGEMRTMMQYLFQSFDFRGDATSYRDLIQGVEIEEISHVEPTSKTITQLLDGAPLSNFANLNI